MTAVLEDTGTTSTPSPAEPAESPIILAPWHRRAGAFVVDVLPAAAVVTTMALVALTVRPSVWWWVAVGVGGLVILLMLVNRLLLPVITGWSWGRALLGVTVVTGEGATPGPWRLLLRDVAHLLDTASALVGWLWPLWDPRRRTFADLLLLTEVRLVEYRPQRRQLRRLTAAVVVAAAVLCAGGAAMSYFLVERRHQEIEQTKHQLEAQGPKLVVDMLTYDPKTLPEDFARAQGLTTDKYRKQLLQQQETVQKGHPVNNQYWVTDESILSATSRSATMLLFLQGQRGLPPDERYISATVRVNFVKTGDTRWRIDDLTVLTKPKPAAGGK